MIIWVDQLINLHCILLLFRQIGYTFYKILLPFSTATNKIYTDLSAAFLDANFPTFHIPTHKNISPKLLVNSSSCLLFKGEIHICEKCSWKNTLNIKCTEGKLVNAACLSWKLFSKVAYNCANTTCKLKFHLLQPIYAPLDIIFDSAIQIIIDVLYCYRCRRHWKW